MTNKTRFRESVQILNVKIDNFSAIEVLSSLEQGVVLTPNVDHLMKLQKDSEFRRVYESADHKLCDSQILLYASHFLGTPLQEKISGSDFFPAFCKFHRHNLDIKVFLLGGTDEAVEKAKMLMNGEIGRQIITGAYSPPFGFEDDEQECLAIIERIKQSGATVLAVGVGAPKQEKWIYKYKQCLPMIKIFMAIGATINFEAGLICRAPKWMSNLGIEWFYRLLSEPQRLWKRYLLDDLPFFWLLLKQKLNLYKDPLAKN